MIVLRENEDLIQKLESHPAGFSTGGYLQAVTFGRCAIGAHVWCDRIRFLNSLIFSNGHAELLHCRYKVVVVMTRARQLEQREAL